MTDLFFSPQRGLFRGRPGPGASDRPHVRRQVHPQKGSQGEGEQHRERDRRAEKVSSAGCRSRKSFSRSRLPGQPRISFFSSETPPKLPPPPPPPGHDPEHTHHDCNVCLSELRAAAAHRDSHARKPVRSAGRKRIQEGGRLTAATQRGGETGLAR